MFSLSKRWLLVCIVASVLVLSLWNSLDWQQKLQQAGPYLGSARHPLSSPWKKVPQRHPVQTIRPLPSGELVDIPQIQYEFVPETPEARQVREARLRAVRESFEHAWKGYKSVAWMKDEVAPVSGRYRTTFGGWAATLVDSLDTLWIMGFHKEFDEAVAAVARIDFNTPMQPELNVFETTIRYLGGLLAAYDLSGKSVLLNKAIELGEMLYVAFDTDNRMPITRWNWTSALTGEVQSAQSAVVVAELGSLSLEFTRLSQLAGNAKYFDAIQRIADMFRQQQKKTKLPGMWPIVVNAHKPDTTETGDFSLGAMSDSLYEYLPKQYMLLGGRLPEYREMYEYAMETAKSNLFFRPMNQQNKDILISGPLSFFEHGKASPAEGQHLVCFAGGMLAIGAKIFKRDDLTTAQKLVDGCIWAYNVVPQGIMPETFVAIKCTDDCKWDGDLWRKEALARATDFKGTADEYIDEKRLPPGMVDIPQRLYLLRPEAIESIFVLYRITGDTTLMDRGWDMFQAIEKHTRTDIAHAALQDVTQKNPPQLDSMESFWTAETLKYFYLLFSEPSVISLDEYVLNTEAHPFRRPMK